MNYSASPLIRAHQPKPVVGDKGYQKYRNCLRLEFDFKCIYCGSRETEVAPGASFGGFEIEHFRPKGRRFRKLRNVYGNLLWSCMACNRAKGDRWPSDAELTAGYRFVDPDREAMAEHLVLNGECVEPLSGSLAGQYTIDTVNLNSALHRQRRRDRAELQRRKRSLETFLRQQEQLISERERQGVDMSANRALWVKVESELRAIGNEAAAPWDRPASCACNL